MILIQLSSAQGPAECCLTVAKTLKVLLKEAKKLHLDIRIIEEEAGVEVNTKTIFCE